MHPDNRAHAERDARKHGGHAADHIGAGPDVSVRGLLFHAAGRAAAALRLGRRRGGAGPRARRHTRSPGVV